MEQFATVIYGLLMVTSVQQDHPLDHEDSPSWFHGFRGFHTLRAQNSAAQSSDSEISLASNGLGPSVMVYMDS